MDVTDYLLSHDELNWIELIAPWRWIFPEEGEFQPWLLNKFGDLTWVDEHGAVFHLNISEGTLEKVAADEDSFLELLEDDDNASDWLMYPLVDIANEAGLTLAEGECYGFTELPILGGDYEIENLGTYPLAEYWKYCGDLHFQLKDVPEDSDEDEPPVDDTVEEESDE